MHSLLRSDPEASDFVLKRVIARTIQYEEALVHQIVNNAERRLARALLHLAKYDRPAASRSPFRTSLRNYWQEWWAPAAPKSTAS